MFLLAVLIWTAFVVVVGAAAAWTREQPLVAVDRVMRQTRTVRASFEIVDELATEQARNVARQQAPRVYIANAAVLDELRTSLENIPRALKDVANLDGVEPGLRQQFALNDERLEAIKQAAEGINADRWQARVTRLMESLARTPILDSSAFQLETLSQNPEIELRVTGRSAMLVPSNTVEDIERANLPERMRTMAAAAGFTGAALDLVAARLSHQPRPTFAFDQKETTAIQEAQAAAVPKRVVTYPDREVIYRRGDTLSATRLAVLEAALNAEKQTSSFWQLWLPRIAVFGVVCAVGLALAGYVALFCTMVRRSPGRMAALAGLMAGTMVLACWATAAQPALIALMGVAPTVFVTVLLAIAYDRRVALAFGALHGALVCLALDQSVSLYAVMIVGIGVAVWQLKEIRDRDALIRTGVLEGLALAGGTFLVGVLELPGTAEAVRQAAMDAGLAGFGGLLVAGVTLFILPTVEKTFDITTGMTLIELRDPKQPLLRQLQQRAPGTYNHSLNLASLAEAAADAIGADGLLAYVGALYHDIGKMNKPEYFVENQTPGINKHDKLSPAMSLLVIVGHVKDGMELAREFNLPRQIWHFIESHHGTTLVEYFFNRAKRQAEAAAGLAAAGVAGSGGGSATGMSPASGTSSMDSIAIPSEMEYRYPGPKPRMKEAAIVMLCDAVESASRAMADPTPSRIDAMVRAIATKRLLDGQFDECDLTLRDLNIIVDSVSKTLASIYHGRIAYPTGPTSAENAPDKPRTSDSAAAAKTSGSSGKSETPALAAGTGGAGGAGGSGGSVPTTRLPAGAMTPVQGVGGSAVRRDPMA
jgi:putative nucleotidyltransferase with HDIG domain